MYRHDGALSSWCKFTDQSISKTCLSLILRLCMLPRSVSERMISYWCNFCLKRMCYVLFVQKFLSSFVSPMNKNCLKRNNSSNFQKLKQKKLTIIVSTFNRYVTLNLTFFRPRSTLCNGLQRSLPAPSYRYVTNLRHFCKKLHPRSLTKFLICLWYTNV